MKSNIYFSQLEGHLIGLPENKKIEIIQDYRRYAEKNELSGENLINELGTPRQLAQKAMVEYSIDEDTIEENNSLINGEFSFSHRIKQIRRQFHLLGMIISFLMSNIAWYPAMFLIFMGLFLMTVLMVIIDLGLVLILFIGLYQVFMGISVFGHHHAIAIFQGGIGLFLVGTQFVGWPIAGAMMRGLMSLLMRYTKSVGLRFAKITGVDHE
ncbi:hypothetical protein G7084_00690 [Weissella coleopterorum]|uniref:DUF1700 domain-containing protein n=1 Tax=Weissella coleopterorum TaxID=2714949 RepID=A0A6G8AXZ0_9LACO|nr:hypothetical protein [Weissella coleopterorum]QIL49971.1 hypothetical protein G7084_00690 [Weissella coleopterorum]